MRDSRHDTLGRRWNILGETFLARYSWSGTLGEAILVTQPGYDTFVKTLSCSDTIRATPFVKRLTW